MRDAGLRFDSELAQTAGDELRRAELAVSQLRILVNVSTVADDARFDAPNGVVDGHRQIFTNATRRFFARPCSVELSAIGFVSPRPFAVSRDASTPCAESHVFTASARACDSFRFASFAPTLSV